MSRTRALGVVAIALLAGALVRGQATPPVSPQTFRTSADVVMVDVSVMRDRTPVAGLTAADFQVRDNGVLQRIESVEAAAVPIDVTLVIDVSGMARSRLAVKASTEKTVAHLNAEIARVAAGLRPVDRLRVLAADTYVQQVVPLSPADSVPPIRRMASGGLSSNYDAIMAAVLQPVEPDRRHVVIASVKVFDTMSGVEAAAVRDVAAQSDALLHVVLMQSASAEAATAEEFQCRDLAICEPVARSWAPYNRLLIDPVAKEAEESTAAITPLKIVPQLKPDGVALQAGAEATGGALHQGQLFSAPTLVATLAKAFEDFRHSYVLRFTPQGVKREGWHTIAVTVPSAKGARIRARHGYAIEAAPIDGVTSAATATSGAATPGASMPLPRKPVEFAAAYDRGDRASIRSAVARSTDPVAMVRDIVSAGNPWPGSPGREAAFILELVDARLTGTGLPHLRVPRDIAQLLERYTRLARHPIEPDAYERAWLWAAICLTEGRFLWVSSVAATDRALQRFPNDPRFILASAIATDQKWRTHGTVVTAGSTLPNQITEGQVATVVSKYRAASASPETATEAHIRLGWFFHRIGRHAEAIAMLDAAPLAPHDPALGFLRHLFKGHTFVATDRLDDAIVAYRAATRAVPGAQSAQIALMSALAARGDSGAAEAMGAQVETAPPAGDPWWNYWLGDYRWYAQARDALRELNTLRR